MKSSIFVVGRKVGLQLDGELVVRYQGCWKEPQNFMLFMWQKTLSPCLPCLQTLSPAHTHTRLYRVVVPVRHKAQSRQMKASCHFVLVFPEQTVFVFLYWVEYSDLGISISRCKLPWTSNSHIGLRVHCPLDFDTACNGKCKLESNFLR